MDLNRKNPQVRRWTRLAVECYNRGCVCKGCYYDTFFSKPEYWNTYKDFNQKCQMKRTVLELVKTIGKPDDKNTLAGVSKEIILDLYIEKQVPLAEIYKRLRIDKYEFDELLRLYDIPKRKKPINARHIG